MDLDLFVGNTDGGWHGTGLNARPDLTTCEVATQKPASRTAYKPAFQAVSMILLLADEAGREIGNVKHR